uniref:GPI ethanolamine phosphate transferase 1 n=1 Tax=Pristionchus pacificus TaxID=54126 RepID=A0A8R1UXS3_PRIPA
MEVKLGILGVIVHLILLYSIFDIYYTSPIIESLNAHRPNSNDPPARRLFLISADGLRYDTFQRKELAPFLHSLIDSGVASFGVSTSGVPTESRPGHVSIVAGFTEDVSAVTRGWKENPVTFDTIFNRSIESFQWGSEDITHLFSHIPHVKTKSFPAEWEDFSSLDNYKLDEWVFDKCERDLLDLPSSSLIGSSRFFFLHLVAIDTNGHGHNPDSFAYTDNLRIVDERVRRLVTKVNQVFNDSKSAYIFTSDHGMTEWGSHGGGTDLETKTPFVVWGSGVNGGAREHIQQIDLCPLMASLLAIPFPINNHGIIRTSLLNTSARFQSSVVMANFLQLREIILHQISHVGKRWWLSSEVVTTTALNSLYDQATQLAAKNRFESISSLVSSQLPLLQRSIFLYHRVDRPLLSILVAASFISFLLLLKISSVHSFYLRFIPSGKLILFLLVSSTASSIFFVSLSHIIYLILPIYLISLIPFAHVPSLILRLVSLSSLPPIMLIILLNYSFYDRRFSSLLTIYLIFLPYLLYHSRPIFSKLNVLLYGVSLSFCPFPFLPPCGVLSFPLLSSIPPIILSIILKRIRHLFPSHNQPNIDHLFSLSLITCSLIIFHSILPSYFVLRFLSWLLIPLPYIIVFRTPPRTPSRLLSLSVALFLPYSLLSSSYESLYLLLLLIFLSIFTRKSSSHSSSLFFHLPLSSTISLSCAFVPLPHVLTFLTLFSTGNLASLSSFSPSSLSRFISVFSPFTMASLLVLKLLSPILLIFIHLRSSLPSLSSSSNLISSTLIISDLLSLIFFYQLRDSGSWLEIGLSIAHFLISLSSSLAFYLLFLLSDYLLSTPLRSRSKHISNA